MPDELVQNNPPVVCWIFAPLEELGFCRIYKGACVGWVGLGIHMIRDNDILESALLTDVIIIREVDAWKNNAGAICKSYCVFQFEVTTSDGFEMSNTYRVYL